MRFAVNFSPQLAALIREGRLSVELFKCPASADAVSRAHDYGHAYVHMPLKTGTRSTGVIDTEKKAAVNWERIDEMLAISETHFVNVHFGPTPAEYPDLDPTDESPEAVERIIADAIHSIEQLTKRYGKSMVIVENILEGRGIHMWASVRPKVISQVIEATDTGFLFDISHARLAARTLGMDEREYIKGLPLHRIREIHATGIQRVEGPWLQRLEEAGLNNSIYHKLIGIEVDHLPFTEEDWDFMQWSVDQIHSGAWRAPEIFAVEYGGIGGFWELMAEPEVLATQIPRLQQMLATTQTS